MLACWLFLATTADAGILDASWLAPTTNVDGSQLTDLAGYRVYYSTSSTPCRGSSYFQVPSATPSPSPGQTVSHRLTGLAGGAPYWVTVTAVDGSGNESACTPTASATARAEIAVTPGGAISFGSVLVGSYADQTLTIQNTTGGTVSGAVVVSPPFSVVSGSPFSMSGLSATRTVTVRFRPTAAAAATANLTVTANGDSVTRLLSGTGTGSSSSDTTPPTVIITSPTTAAAFSTSSWSMSLSGTASDNVGVTQVTWTNNRGGSGTASGTTSWTAADISLQAGVNVLTVTARDAAGNARSATLTVTQASTSPPLSSTATLTLAYNGKLRDRVGQGNTWRTPDNVLDGTFTVTLAAPGGRTVTGLELQSSAPGVWDTTSATPYWVLGVASTLDGALLNDATTMGVSFWVGNGESFVLFAADYQDSEFLPGRVLTLTARFSDGSSAIARTTISTPQAPQPTPPTLSLVYNGKLRDRVGQGNTALGPDGAADGTLTATLSASGGRRITALQLESSAPGTWQTSSASPYWVLGVASTLDGPLLNSASTMGVNFQVADGGSFILFAADYNDSEFLPGRTLTLTATLSDGTSVTASTTVGAGGGPPSLTLRYLGKLRDRVGQGNTWLGADGALDGTLTVTLSAPGGRTITGLQLESSAPGVWDTDAASHYWVLGVAAALDAPLLNNPVSGAVRFAVPDGGSFVLFASDWLNREFASGVTLTLTVAFSDATSVTSVARIP